MFGKKSVFKAAIAIALSLSVLLPALAASTASGESTSPQVTIPATPGATSGKEEVIYASLSPDGAMKNVYVVNVLDVTTAGAVSDYGDYTDLRNLTDVSEITPVDGGVSLAAPVGRFYYQGTLRAPSLPWDVDITYTLDGEAVTPSALAGKTGKVTINVKTAYGGAGQAFYDHYLLQVSLSLDTGICENIVSPGATTALAGSSRMITHTVLPGQNANIDIAFDAANFKMPGVEISAVPFSMASAIPEFDLSSLKSGFSELTDAVGKISDGASALYDGADAQSSGAKGASSGSETFLSGLKTLASGSDGLVGGSSEILAALKQIAAAVSGSDPTAGIAGAAMLPAVIRQLSNQLGTAATGLATAQTAFSQAYAELDAAITALPSASVSEASFAALYAASPSERAAIDALAGYYAAGRAVAAAYAQVKPAFDGTNTALTSAKDALTSVSGTLGVIATQAESVLSGSDIAQLTQGLTMLAEDYGTFHSGLVKYTNGVNGLSSGYAPLNTGVSSLAEGADGIATGLKGLRDGLDAMKTQTSAIPARIDDEIKKITDSLTGEGEEFVPESFVSSQNQSVDAVQFVIRTDKIEPPAPPPPPDAPAAKQSFWDKFLDLFR
jgi:X-X-X-Leu-X-X-Gly heptad repeat protein